MADKIFEPTMQSPHLVARYLGTIFSTSAGSGIAFLYVLCAVWDVCSWSVVLVMLYQFCAKVPCGGVLR
ncbi:hypothetical protein [Chroogloeocystis siderophila]|uniref:hypothetical protein n=1 Tax=Chroogloeocystis siderophila TaxID=329163 RepID=UPI0011615055|nr:hypothetical protein [Chroogloeocystis siderophila]